MKTSFVTTSLNLDRLFECNRVSAQVWNDCLEISKQHHKECGKWITKTELQKRTKGKYHLHSQSVQAVCHKYLWARDNTKKARDKGISTVRYPYKIKHHYNTKWAKDGFRVYENGIIELSVGIREGKRQKPIVIWIKDLPAGWIKEIELIYDRRLMVCLSYEDGLEAEVCQGNQTAAVDMGEIHAIAAVTESGQGILLTGRKLRSIKRFRNKKLAELQRKMSKCKKVSRQWRKYHRAKQYILSKSDAQLKDTLHKISKKFVDWCSEQAILQVVVGDVEGVQRHTSGKKKRNKRKRNRQTNQKLSQWQFGKLQDYLSYKLAAKGIGMERVDESYTSQTCPVCHRRQKVSGRVYTCPCSYHQHRDIHGASNILAQFLHGQIQLVNEQVQIKYLRVA